MRTIGLVACAASLFFSTAAFGHAGGKSGKSGRSDEYEVAGSFTVAMSPPSSVVQVSPDLCVIELNPTFTLSGDLEGSFTSPFVLEHLGPCDQPAPEYFSTAGVFEGELLGAQGSFTFEFEGSIDGQGNALGDLVIDEDSGTDELAELEEGTITLGGVAGVGGNYAGSVEFD